MKYVYEHFHLNNFFTQIILIKSGNIRVIFTMFNVGFIFKSVSFLPPGLCE